MVDMAFDPAWIEDKTTTRPDRPAPRAPVFIGDVGARTPDGTALLHWLRRDFEADDD